MPLPDATASKSLFYRLSSVLVLALFLMANMLTKPSLWLAGKFPVVLRPTKTTPLSLQ